jgi:hypothetical protein
MRDLENPGWRESYNEALSEFDPGKLVERVADAEMSILFRMQALQTSSDGHVERKAIGEALNGLRILQTEKLNYPGW